MANKPFDWTPEAETAIKLCSDWASVASNEIPSDIYLFGSAIYKGGDQFDPQRSDLDVVVVFKADLDATERVKRLVRLQFHKANLELSLIPALQRTNCVSPGVSIVPITKLELRANIHKSGSRSFFERNIFLNLKTMQQSVSLPDAGIVAVPDDNRQALEFSQKIRNQFLAVGANGTGGIDTFYDSDPLPKALARVAAQLVPDAEEGEWYDTRLGLEFLYDELTRRRDESGYFQSLHRSMSIRRGGKGRKRPLDGRDQLLLAEVLYDLAAAVHFEPIVTWEIRFKDAMLREAERDRIIEGLRRLVPDARILKVTFGSIIVRLRSSRRSYETISKLNELNALPKFFAVDEVELSSPGSVHDFVGLDASGLLDQIANHIATWRPRASDDGRQLEANLASWLTSWIKTQPNLAGATLLTEVAARAEGRQLRPDLLLRFGAPQESERRLAIELVRLKSRSSFFQRLEYVLQFGVPTILVVVGPPNLLGTLSADIERLEHISGEVRVLTVADNNG